MKKTILSIAFSIAALFLTSTNVYAGSCTAVLDGPSVAAGSTNVGPAYALASSYATATGNNAKTYFYNLYSLSNSFVAWNDRTVTLTLMEQDGWFNGDDQVKIYKGGFTGRTMSSVYVYSTTTPGNIEGSGDHISELYLNTNFAKHSSDPSGASRSFFDYQLCQE